MAIEATYALNNMLLPKLQAVDSSVTFYPGNSAPESQGHVFVLYSTTQNNPAELFMLNTDSIRYRVIHTDFEKMQKMVSTILSAINVWEFDQLFTGKTDDSKTIVPLYLHAMSTSPGNDFFPDSVEYYYTNMSVTLNYKLV